MDLGLAGKKALVTGATRGIGRAIADTLSNEGCSVAFCARTEEAVQAMVQSYEGKGVSCFGRAVDVADHDAFVAFCTDAAEALGGLDIFVWNTSAVSADWSKSFEVDVHALVKATDVLVPHLKASGEGAIVFIASLGALLGYTEAKSYAAMKAVLLSYCCSMARELAPAVRVNAVSPGEVLHEGSVWERVQRHLPERYEAAIKRNPFGRLANPQEVANVVAFLASPAASFVSGVNVVVDGASREFTDF